MVDRARHEGLQVQLSLSDPEENAKFLQGIPGSVSKAYDHRPQSANFAGIWRRARASAAAARDAAFVARASDALDAPNILVLDELATPYGRLRNRSGGTIPCI